MKDLSYPELKAKFQALAEENNSLKTKIVELESALRLTHLSHLVSHPEPTSDPSAPSVSIDISDYGADKPVNHFSPISEKVALFMSLFRGRSDG